MIVKPIVKLIDEAIIPALLIVTSKVSGVLLVSYILKIDFTVTKYGLFNLLPGVNFGSATDYLKVENYSNLLMLTAIAAGTLLVVLKAHFLHETHISPRLHQKLAKFKLENFVSTSFHIYHQAAIWLIFLWLTTLFLLISNISKITYSQISLLAIFIAVNFTWILAYDIQKELDL